MIEIQELALTFSAGEASSMLRSIPLSQNITIIDVFLIDNGIEAVVRTSSLLGMPMRVRFMLQEFQGSKIILQTSSPVKHEIEDNLKSFFKDAKVLTQDNYTLVEMDLLNLAKGRLQAIEIEDIAVSKTGLKIKFKKIQINGDWKYLFSQDGDDSR